MNSIAKLVDVLNYTEEDLQDSKKYDEYVDVLSEVIDDIEDSPFQDLINELVGRDLVDYLDGLVCHADEIHDSEERKCTEKALTNPCGCRCKCESTTTHAPSKKFSVEELVNDYLKQSDIQKSFTKSQHYYQALALLTDFAEYVINK
jgi:hypothetical protein